jgi:hypothetical protein
MHSSESSLWRVYRVGRTVSGLYRRNLFVLEQQACHMREFFFESCIWLESFKVQEGNRKEDGVGVSTFVAERVKRFIHCR